MTFSKKNTISFEGELRSRNPFRIIDCNMTLMMHADHLELKSVMFNWGDSYDAKVSRSAIIPMLLSASRLSIVRTCSEASVGKKRYAEGCGIREVRPWFSPGDFNAPAAAATTARLTHYRNDWMLCV